MSKQSRSFSFFNKNNEALLEQIKQSEENLKKAFKEALNEQREETNKRLQDHGDRLRDIEFAMRADEGRPAEPRYGYRGKALIERPEDRDELGLFF